MTTLQDYIHAINLLQVDRDVYVDGIDSIAVCCESKITPAGRAEFALALSMPMDEYGDVIGRNDEDYDLVDDGEGGLCAAWRFLNALAGYCAASEYERMFEGDDAELI